MRTGISREDVAETFEATARVAGMRAALGVVLDYAEAAQLQAILEDLADTAATAPSKTQKLREAARRIERQRAEHRPT